MVANPDITPVLGNFRFCGENEAAGAAVAALVAGE
jgi:hypothetical protein